MTIQGHFKLEIEGLPAQTKFSWMKSVDGLLHSRLQEVDLTQIPAYHVIIKDLRQLIQLLNDEGPITLASLDTIRRHLPKNL